MKVAHICVGCFYIDGAGYQENKLVTEHVKIGHEVRVFASTENHNSEGEITYGVPGCYVGGDGAKVYRLPYLPLIPLKLAAKLRVIRGLFRALCEFSPDLIMVHGLCSWELFTVSAYKKNNPKCKFVIDSHEDHNNSARNFGSWLLHRYYYRPILKCNLPTYDRAFYISLETADFIRVMYDVDVSYFEYLPLGGDIKPDDSMKATRNRVRQTHSVSDEHIVFLQSGKFTQRKKLSQSLHAFKNTDNPNFEFWIAGVFQDDVVADVSQIIRADSRIKYLGWVSADHLEELLLACDVYLQPGTQSVTMQAALCAGCPVAIDNVKSHLPYVKGNGWLMSSVDDLKDIFKEISEDPNCLEGMSEISLEFAKKNLDYQILADRVLL